MPDHDASATIEPFEAFYARMVNTLRFVAHVRHGVPLADAEGIVHDAFVKYVRDYSTIREPARWLVTVVANASRNYRRDHLLETPLPPTAEERWGDPAAERAIDLITTRLTLAAAFKRLDERCRDVLYRYHIAGDSVDTLAEQFGTTPGYIRLRLHLCRKRARAIYLSLAKVNV